jgi:hypothetical protein
VTYIHHTPSTPPPPSTSAPGGDSGLPLLLQQLPQLHGYILHSRWFSNSTDYAGQNGGRFKFVVEGDSAAFPGNGRGCLRLQQRACVWLLRRVT